MPKNPHGQLSDKQRRFVEEYAKDFNGTQAAVRAGYSKRTAGKIASENLKKPEIRTELGKLLGELTDDSRLTAARVLEEISLVAFVRLGDYVTAAGDFDVLRFAKEHPAALAEIETEVIDTGAGKKRKRVAWRRGKVHDKLEALRDLGRYFKLFQTDVRKGDVPKDATPAAPRAVQEFTTEELLEIVANGAPAKPTRNRRRR